MAVKIQHDGVTFLPATDSDAYEVRVGYYGQLLCSREEIRTRMNGLGSSIGSLGALQQQASFQQQQAMGQMQAVQDSAWNQLLQQQQQSSVFNQPVVTQEAGARLREFFDKKPTPTKGKKVNVVKEYLNNHRDTIMTLGFALLVDHFVLNGALRARIQRVVEALLAKVEKALGVTENELLVK